MLDQLQFHNMKLTWLEGAVVHTDGGTLFGPVPKAVWGRYYPYDELNRMPSVTDPILIQYQGKNYLIDTSFTMAKLSEKDIRNTGIMAAPRIEESLHELGLTYDDIDVVMMSHMHNDHANGLTYPTEEGFKSRYPKAVIYISEIEWEEVRNPNMRTRNTYQKDNWEAIQNQVETFQDKLEVAPGITMELTGGHSRGHSMIRLEQAGETIFYLADILLSVSHANPLYVGGVDDYPMDSVAAKTKYLNEALSNGYRFIFYHDPFYRMLKYTEDGKAFTESLKCSKPSLIPLTEKQDKFPQERKEAGE